MGAFLVYVRESFWQERCCGYGGLAEMGGAS